MKKVIKAQQYLHWLVDNGYASEVNTNTYNMTVQPYSHIGHLQEFGYPIDTFTETDYQRLDDWAVKCITADELDKAVKQAKARTNHEHPGLKIIASFIRDIRISAKEDADKQPSKPKGPNMPVTSDVEDTPEREAIGRQRFNERMAGILGDNFKPVD